MADAQKLKTFQIKPTRNGEGAMLHIATDTGEELTVSATRDQLDVIADELDDMLDSTEAEDEA